MTGKLLSEEEEFYSFLNIEVITDVDYTKVKRDWKDFQIKSFDECQDFYAQSNTLLPYDVFENSWTMLVKLFKLDFVQFFSALGLAYQAALNKSKGKLDKLIDIDILLTVEKGGISVMEYAILFTDMWTLIIKNKRLW